ncbi:MAG: HNH endonuclease [Solirubrobacteraceae bacterium]
MATSWLQYWNPEQLAVERQSGSEGEPLTHTAGEQFAGVAAEDTVYVVGASDASLLLIGRLYVVEVLDHAGAKARFGSGLYEATYHLLGSGTVSRLDRVVPRGVAKRLRRASGKALVDTRGEADGRKLQSVGPLKPASARLLDGVLDRDDVRVPVTGLREGGVSEQKHRRVERHPNVRDAALRLHGVRCMVCDFDFETCYGPRGTGFAEVHHLQPLASLKGKTVITNPQADVAVLCANCHRMIHRGPDAPIALDDLHAQLKRSHRA